MEKYSNYEFEIKKVEVNEWNDRYDYIIYGIGCWPYDDGKIESEEWYDTEQEARFAAIGHISLLENGGG